MKKGELLERVVAHFCSNIKGAKVTHDAKVIGRDSGIERQVDVLIEGRYGFCSIKIQIEAKDYNRPVSVDRVEAFVTMVKDTGVNLGAMVSTSGFSSTAKSIAAANNIQLFEVVSDILGNTNLFIPLRMIIPQIESFSIQFSGTQYFCIPGDLSRIRVEKEGKFYDLHQRLIIAWNEEKVPRFAGEHLVCLDAVKIFDVENSKRSYYCNLAYRVNIREKYYLKLYPANFMRNVLEGRNSYDLRVDFYTKEEDMQKHWIEFSSLEELNSAADIENQPDDIRELVIRPYYSMRLDSEIEQKE
ncbi:hypothetical protein COU80_05365 [Candidatus Peregrinibacteria bacterium CG10_big_fil_rev_8_21_14_0_10_55_24]|nr:MAG: hypothetical protein COU80_05365 [Candidatus Peregrinibacteria bacterium CG10_big_fil_rev_8_21_14_0_10_55_24]